MFKKRKDGSIVTQVQALTAEEPGRAFAHAYLPGPGTAKVQLVMPGGKVLDLAEVALHPTGLTPLLVYVRRGESAKAADLLASITPDALAVEV